MHNICTNIAHYCYSVPLGIHRTLGNRSIPGPTLGTIVGAAYGYAFPDDGPPRAKDFSGGEATVERILSDLGFEVGRVGQDWTQAEAESTVSAYFEMLR